MITRPGDMGYLRALATETPGEGEILGLNGDTCIEIKVSDRQGEVECDERLAWIAAKLVSSKRETR